MKKVRERTKVKREGRERENDNASENVRKCESKREKP